MSEQGKDKSFRPIFRFGIRSLLVLIACVACYLAGHRAGFKTGYFKASAEYGEESPSLGYDVSDLVIPIRD